MLCLPILVLNKSWRVLRLTTVKKALGMLYTGAAVVVCTDTYRTYDFSAWISLMVDEQDDYISTSSLQIKIPEVIQLTSYDGYLPQKLNFSRKNIHMRDNNTCQYCGRKVGRNQLTVDHIVPRSHGGRSVWTNCVLACIECNIKKSNKTLEESGMKLLRPPKKPEGQKALFFPGTIKSSWKPFIRDC